MKAEINISFSQILELIRQLPKEKKVDLSKELEKEAIESKLTELLTEFQTDELSFEEITHEVEAVRQELYVNQQSIKVIFDTNIWISYLIGQQIHGFTRFESFRGNRNFGTSRI